MRIGIDTDGVLTDMASFLQIVGSNYLKREPSNVSAYSVEEMFGASKWEKLRYGMLLFVNYCKNCPPRDGTKKVLDQLKRDGYELYEITARKFVTMKNPLGKYSRKMLLAWYQKHGLEFSNIVFCSETNTGKEKAKACLELEIKIMVEDKPDVVKSLAEEGITVLLFDAPYNQNISGAGIIRCCSWDEVYQNIKVLNREE